MEVLGARLVAPVELHEAGRGGDHDPATADAAPRAVGGAVLEDLGAEARLHAVAAPVDLPGVQIDAAPTRIGSQSTTTS